MTSKFKYFAALLIMIAVIFACSSNKDKDKQNTQKQKPYKDTVEINKDQYRIAENFVGPKNQIIDLLQDTVTFDITYEGTGPFKCTLSYPDGTTLAVLADVTGNFKGKKQLVIPETRAYVLDVDTEGKWSVYRE